MIKRDAFLYFDPKGNKDKFAQCETCMMWTGPKGKTCTIHGRQQKVKKGDSCGLYVNGPNHTDMIGKEMDAIKKKESGLISANVRCENCKHFNPPETCNLYHEINEECEEFDLDEKVNPKGCCNAFESEEVKDIESLKRVRDKKLREENE